jgi:DNA ligase (NAD+)
MGRILDTPYIGQEISVYKANMIIPQVDHGVPMDVVPMDVTTIDHPLSCPCCKTDVTVKESKGGVKTLVCENDDCPSKMIGKLEHFCKRDCLNIVGMSGETIEKLVNAGFVKRYSDFFHLNEHPGIAQMDGFGKRSFEKMVSASEKARTTDFVSFIHSLGIPNVGKGQAKLLKNYIEAHMEELCPTYDENKPVDYYSILTDMFDKNFDFRKIDGFGDVIQKSLYEFRDKYVGTPNRIPKSFDVQDVYDELGFTDVCKKKDKNSAILEGKTFVITGDVHVFKNRNEISEKIESLGGKVSGSVSAKTSYLINNDVTSTSGKNKKAQDLNIPIISEEDFLAMIEPEKTEDMGR